MVVEQAGIGAVDAGKTNQRGGNPCEFHLSLSYLKRAIEREGQSNTLLDTSTGVLDLSLDAKLHR